MTQGGGACPEKHGDWIRKQEDCSHSTFLDGYQRCTDCGKKILVKSKYPRYCCEKLWRLIVDMNNTKIYSDMVVEIFCYTKGVYKEVEHEDMMFVFCPYCSKKLDEFGWGPKASESS